MWYNKAIKREELITMTIYHLTIRAYDYWFACDRGGFVTIDKYFTTEEKAQEWIRQNPRYIYRGFNEKQTEAKEGYQMPTFNITAITVE
jgi:hypothetical protein